MYEVLKAGQRETGKHIKAKQMRKEGWIPGVIFGKNQEPVHFKVPAMTIQKFLTHSGKVFEVEVESAGKHLVNVQELQWNHLGNELVHVSFHKLQAGHKCEIPNCKHKPTLNSHHIFSRKNMATRWDVENGVSRNGH